MDEVKDMVVIFKGYVREHKGRLEEVLKALESEDNQKAKELVEKLIEDSEKVLEN